MKIGIAIKKLRKERVPQLRQSQLAEAIGISQTYLSLIEKGKKIPSVEIYEKIAEYFKMPLPILFWYCIEEHDIPKEKWEYFRLLKPSIDKLIEVCF